MRRALWPRCWYPKARRSRRSSACPPGRYAPQAGSEEAKLKLKQAELDLEKAQKPTDPADLVAAEKAIQAAQTTLANASGARPTTIDQAQSALRSAELTLEATQRDHNKLLDYKSWGYDVESQLRASEVRLANLRAAVEIARRNAADAGALAAQSIVEAEQTLAAAQAKYDRLKKQPEPENVRAAQLAVEAARLALARAEANLKNATLVTPIAGAVAEVKIKAGQQVANGAPLITLADTSAWLVETDNLTELSVVQVQPGKSGSREAGCRAGTDAHGPHRADRRALARQARRGGVHGAYRAGSSDPRMRWGMTALVEFE